MEDYQQGSSIRVIIIGGAITGLTLAHCLDKAGIDYIVLEKHENVSTTIGGSIGLQANGCRILDQVGVYDACHTHSPKAGQGMNVLMMDSYNLAWKPAYPVNGLSNTSSDTAGPNPLLDTYHLERHANAEELINFDRKFSTSFSDKVGTAESKSGVSHEEFVNMFSPGNSFTSGVGVEYPENLIVDRALSAGSRQPVRGDDYLSGILRPGRRLLNVKLKRFADGWHRDIQDDLASTRRFRIVSLVSHDLLNAEGISATAMKATSAIVHQFPPSLLEQIVIYPRWPGEVTWKNIPGCVKEQAEMSFYNGYDLEDAYQIYGADPAQGALVVIRPDGYVGLVAQLSESSRVEGHLSRIITRVD